MDWSELFDVDVVVLGGEAASDDEVRAGRGRGRRRGSRRGRRGGRRGSRGRHRSWSRGRRRHHRHRHRHGRGYWGPYYYNYPYPYVYPWDYYTPYTTINVVDPATATPAACAAQGAVATASSPCCPLPNTGSPTVVVAAGQPCAAPSTSGVCGVGTWVATNGHSGSEALRCRHLWSP